MDHNVVALPIWSRIRQQPVIEPQDFLDPVEVDIVRSFLAKGEHRTQPPEDWFADAQSGDSTPPPSIRLCRLEYDEMSDIAVRNAVARICLNAVQARLPQWGLVDRNGQVALTRSRDRGRAASFDLAPQHLFTLNWADSGPGFSWPEAYHATFLPGFDRWVVTMSVDSPDMFGCTDLALGSFSPGSDLVRASGRIIIGYWRKYQCYDEDTEGWAYLFNTGLVDNETACRWRKRVWRNAARVTRTAWL